ncbi:hypothetical protein GRJ2_000156000 [Grus japonensis]|uniref:Uncharacterized protein n=1 Tax=Grus japonensis TaxID=30415 RepID=A0ABC9VVP7_GRUJA
MNEKLQTNPKYKKGEYKRWEQGQVTQEKLETLSACAKAHLELNLRLHSAVGIVTPVHAVHENGEPHQRGKCKCQRNET